MHTSRLSTLLLASSLVLFTGACGGESPESEGIRDRGVLTDETPDSRGATGTTTAGTTGVPGSEGPGTTLDQDPGSATSQTTTALQNATEGSPHSDHSHDASTTRTNT